ncbi:hypothetical protein SteCoe_16120 [Stentor coeruleus]|uniref:ODAD1 central coiled coil region domain-containing protein n=1 Tax=Stentor coeruleus TaxID=5963 RepID=A0A1R2C1X8_9CILI|nr:hypothetical protein SteCoe_16120 [Stentor coeruleus]
MLNTSLKEPESARLGKDSERLVEYMEHEKREAVYLDQQLSLLKQELTQLKTMKKAVFPTSSSEEQQKHRCSILEKRIELELISLNETKAQSQKLRNEINNLRKDKCHYKRTLQNLKDDIVKYSIATEEKKQEYISSVDLESKYKKQIQNLRSKSMLSQSQYSQKVLQLSSFIQDKVDTRKQLNKQIEDSILGQIKKQSDSVEISKIQKTLLERWEEKMKDKKKAMDGYMKHLNILQETFDQIKQATGIHSVPEIVTSVIKSEEQNYEVCSYVNSLNSEIDIIQETYTRTMKDIEIIESQPPAIVSTKDFTLFNLKEKKSRKREEYEMLYNQVQSLLPVLKKIWECCEDTPIPLPKPKYSLGGMESMEYEQVAEFLGHIENYLGYAVVFLKHIEPGFDDKKREKTPFNPKELDIKDVMAESEFEDSKNPLTAQEFQQRTLNMIAEMNSKS